MLKISRVSAATWLAIISVVATSCSPAAAPAPKAADTARSPLSTATASPSTSNPTPSPKPGSDQPRSGGILTRANFGDPSSLDLHQESTITAHLPLANCYNGLARFAPDEAFKVVPDLAEKWDISPDATTYTFQLRKGVKWHDGKPFTAEDVKFSLERMVFWKENKIVSPRGGTLLSAVKAVDIAGPDTVKVTLKYASASFIGNAASGWVIMAPKHVIQEKGDMKKIVVGTGAFKLQDYSSGASYKLVKNPDYFVKGLPYLDGITMYIVKDDATRFAAFRTGQVKMTTMASRALSHSEAEWLRKEMADKITVVSHPAHSRLTMFIDVQKKPWDDIRVRRAANLALDRQAAIKINFNVGTVGAAMDPGGIWGIPASEIEKRPGFRQPKDADVAEAKRLLAEAGYANGFKAELLCTTGRISEAFGTVIKDQLGKVGIDLSLDVKEQASVTDKMNRRAFELLLWRPTGVYDDPDAVLGSYYPTGSAANYSELSDKQIDDLFAKQAATLDEQERKKTVLQMQERILELAPDIVVFWDLYNMGFWKEVRGYKPGGGPYTHNNLDHVWLEK